VRHDLIDLPDISTRPVPIPCPPQVRYRPELDLVLHDLSFSVRGKDKVCRWGRGACKA